MENLIDSLQTSQDFLRRHSLCCRRWRDDSFIKSLDSRRAKWIANPVPRAGDLDCLSDDWLAGMCFLRLRLMSMDARYERQEGSSSRKLMNQAMGRRRTNGRTSWVPGRMPKDTTALTWVHTGLRGWQGCLAVADWVGTSPNGLRTKRSPPHCACGRDV